MKKILILLIPAILLVSCKEDESSSSAGEDRDLVSVSVSRSYGWETGDRINVNGQVSDPLPLAGDGAEAVFSVPSVGAPW